VTPARTAFVTGGSRGIGRVRTALAGSRPSVAFCYSSDDDGRSDAVGRRGRGGEALAIQTSVADAPASTAFSEIEERSVRSSCS
jgi:NAD(P)-dependent dehydrogenase (short-subunit alcohol dehydrogenase family)